MSTPGREKKITRDASLSEAFNASNDDVEAIFHKNSYMKQLTQNASNKTLLEEQFGLRNLSPEHEKFLLGNQEKKWEHSQIYKWVDPETEAKAILNSRRITRGAVEDRERKRYNVQLSYGKGDYDWLLIPENKRNDPAREWNKRGNFPLAEGKFLLVPKTKMTRPIRKSSYLSWILEPDSPFSQHTRVFSLPPYEENFWNNMLSDKASDPGYLTLDKAGFQSKQNLAMKNTEKLIFHKLYLFESLSKACRWATRKSEGSRRRNAKKFNIFQKHSFICIAIH